MYATKDFPKCGFGHCFGFQYVPSVFQLLGILATFFGGIGWCLAPENSENPAVGFQASHKRHRREKAEPVMESVGCAMPKESKRRKVPKRCKSGSAEGNLWGNTPRHWWKTVRLEMDSYTFVGKVRKANERVQCKMETCLPSIQDAPSFGECIQLAGENWNLEDEFPVVKVQFGRVHVNGVCHSENSRLLS